METVCCLFKVCVSHLYKYPIVQISFNGEEILSFNEGKESLLYWVETEWDLFSKKYSFK